MNIQKLLTDHIDIWTAAETEKKSGRGRSSGNAGNVYGIKKLRELILELAVRGKLVPQDANDEPASELLKRIQAEKARLVAEGKIKSKSPLTPLLQRGESTATAVNSNTTSPPFVKGGPGGISESEMPFELPTGWEWTRLEHLFALVTDGDHQAPPKSESGVPFLVIGNLNTGNISLEDCRFVPEKYYEKLDWGKKPTNNDLLYTVTGSYGIPVKVDISEKFCVQRHVAILKTAESTPIDYLIFLLKSKYALQYATDIATGIAQKTVPLTGLRLMPIATPPLVEQHRIVAKVDELMALCDQLETQHSNAAEAHEKLVSHLLGTLTQSPTLVSPLCKRGAGGDLDWQRIAEHFDTLFTTEASIDALKQTLLQLAVMGKLVPQNPSDEPASELLKRIQAEKARLVAEGKIKSKSPLTPLLQRGGSKATAMAAMSSTAAFESESAPPTPISPISPPLVKGGPGGISEHEMPFELPLGWEWCQLVDICIQITDGTHQTPKYVPIGRPFLSAQNVKPFKFMPSDHKFVSQDDFENLRKNRIPEKGDILLTRVGAMIGEAAIIDVDFEFAFYVSLALLKLSRQSVISPFIVLWLNSPLGTSTSVKNTLGRGVSAGNLNLSLIRNFLIGLPPLAEQHRIVAKVDELMALCDQLKSRISESRQLQQKLADVLVEQAVSQ